MEFFQRENHKTNNNKKKRLTQDQVRLLERSFSSNKKLEPERKVRLAKELGIPPRQVAVWYQNKRARWRTQSLERDYGSLQLRLQNALAEKRKLEREVDQLRGELQKAKEILGLKFAVEYKKPAPIISTSTVCKISSDWCEEFGGSSRIASFRENYNDNQDHRHVVMNHDNQIDSQLDDPELFAFLMGSDDDGVNC